MDFGLVPGSRWRIGRIRTFPPLLGAMRLPACTLLAAAFLASTANASNGDRFLRCVVTVPFVDWSRRRCGRVRGAGFRGSDDDRCAHSAEFGDQPVQRCCQQLRSSTLVLDLSIVQRGRHDRFRRGVRHVFDSTGLQGTVNAQGSEIPEPGTWFLSSTALLAVMSFTRKARKR
ncbi:MAG: hypothetical protein JWP63_5174 [Candidatus Solibacter sp.]|nr:hypothetical protein [Candidatus Solibacter sp.]